MLLSSLAARIAFSIYDNMVVHEKSGIWIYLSFDYQSNIVDLKIKDTAMRSIIITPKIKDNIFIRISGWTQSESLHVVHEYKKIGRYSMVLLVELQAGYFLYNFFVFKDLMISMGQINPWLV